VGFHRRPGPAKTGQGISKEFLIRMKRSLALALTMASGLTLSAFAQSPAAPAAASATVPSAKVAVIAFQVVVTQTNEFQRDYADLTKKYEPRKAHLKELNDQIDSLTKQLQAPGVSDADRTAKGNDIENKKKQLQRDAEDAQNDFQQDLQQTFGSVAQKVGELMTSYAHEQGYTLVLDASQQDSPILYAVDTVNITRPVLEAYNTKSGIPAPAQTAAPAPAPAHPAARPTTSH
jgi:outer membrane protein